MTSTNRSVVQGLGVLGLAVAVAVLLGLPGGSVLAQDVTFAKDVAPILYNNCVDCHHEGSFTPMSLMTYENAKKYASRIRYRVSRREMPPWHVDQTVGIQQYANDTSLSDDQVHKIVEWVDEGAPKGNDADMPSPPDIPEGDAWQLQAQLGRAPDVVVHSTPYTVHANGQDQWWDPDVKWQGLPKGRWMMAYEFKPAYPKGLQVVHHGHANLMIPGQNGERGVRVAIAHYGVGKRYEIFPKNTGMYIPPGGGTVGFDLHYSPMNVNFDVPNDVVDIGLWFYPEDQPPPQIKTEGEVLFRVDRINGYDRPMPRANDILIPPHGYQVLQGVHVLDQPALINSFRPHMHTRGKEMSMEAIFPDGHREVLGKVSDYKHIWQLSYIYAENAKPLLPKGTVLLFTSVFDNTEDNPLNPDPDQWVVFGRRGVDEMSHMWVGITYLTDQQYQQMKQQRESIPVAQAGN